MTGYEKNPERYWFEAVYRQLCAAVIVNYRGEKLWLTDLIFDDETEMRDALTQGQVWLYDDQEAEDAYHPAEVEYRKNLELYEVYDDYGRCVLLEPMAGIRVLIERKDERTAYTGKCPNCGSPFVNRALPTWSDGWDQYCKCDNCGEFYREFWAAEDVIVDRLDPETLRPLHGKTNRQASETTRIFGKEEKMDMIESNDRQPRKVHCSRSIGVVRKTFEEVLDVLSDWHEKGYRLRSVEWNSDTQRYTIQGSHDVWVYE